MRGMANATGAIIELSNYLEARISQKSAEFAAVISNCTYLFDLHYRHSFYDVFVKNTFSLLQLSTK